MQEILLSPRQFAELVQGVAGDPRSRYRVGETLIVRETGTEREIHLHLTFLDTAPEVGGRCPRFGMTVLPVDARWNRLWTEAMKEPPMFRSWLHGLMRAVNEAVDEETFLGLQHEG